MNITVLGATGRTGSKLVKSLEKDHQLTLLVRDPDKVANLELNPQVIVSGNVLNIDDLRLVIHEDTDLVISCLATDKQNTLSRMANALIARMEEFPAIRFIGIGTAGILDARHEPGKYRFQSTESKRSSTAAAEDHLALYEKLRQSQTDWTIICPTYLPDDDQERPVVFELNRLPEGVKRIGTASLARFITDHLQNSDFIHHRVGAGEGYD
ncbi:NAD(P)-dependent oxidoreductase [Salisediminibacterium beveridgei]|uniref:Oxidoreductase, putative n=1 Tax=Salisediminibacterium beveridgei TaxID=632773 RepID=A0A1D7QTV3_9BACI|nr:NAD(P)H-binding protein [Salisediminibacterium beveridgei]AOM82441.1 oxidoreductase, putative [Salisediminibacterium beveridgei]